MQVDYEKVRNLAGRGLSKKEIALCLGYSPDWLMRRQKIDKRFVQAMEQGHAQAVSAVTAQLLKNIQMGNMTGIIFWLKCRAGWKETTVIETKNALPIELPVGATDQEVAEAYWKAVRGDM